MSSKIYFLGTGGSIPTKDRSLPSIVVKYDSELLMFDCGEGTQRQMGIARLSPAKKMKIFISHMHGDHVLGLPGLMQSMALLGRENSLDIYGPKGIRRFVESVSDAVQFRPTFPVNVHEIRGRTDSRRKAIRDSFGQCRPRHFLPRILFRRETKAWEIQCADGEKVGDS